MTDQVPLKRIAKVIRSKNCGPFEITFDIIFATAADYQRVKASNVITRELISKLYNVPADDISTFGFFDRIHAIKATMPRPRPQGTVGETDMHACQQHAPLAEILIPWPADAAGEEHDGAARPTARS